MSKSDIMVVDDHPILREGIVALVNREPDFNACAEASSIEEALSILTLRTFQLAIVDISLEGGSGLDLIKLLRSRHPSMRCLVVSMHDEALYAERALRAGARGYVMKQEAPRKIVTALRAIRDGELYVSDAMRTRLLERIVDPAHARNEGPLAELTDREMEVLRLVGRGLKTAEIARALHRSVNTVDAHRANIKRKLGLTSAAELARYAFSLDE